MSEYIAVMRLFPGLLGFVFWCFFNFYFPFVSICSGLNLKKVELKSSRKIISSTKTVL